MNISKVSKKLNLTPNTLRYYEQEKLIPPVHRDANGYRDYMGYDLNWIYFVKCMRKSGMSVEAIAEYTKLFLEDRHQTIDARKEILKNERNRMQREIEKIQQSIALINHKLDIYDGKFQFAEDQIDPYIQHKLIFKGDVDNENRNI